MLHRLVFVFGLVLVTGCFDPKFKEQIACGANGECPPGRMCGPDQMCHSTGGTSHDAAVDAQPDATPVECMGDGDCMTPPDACTVNGVCDMSQHICVFQPRDCSGMADECNDGACNVQTGCVKAPSHQGNACGLGNQCPAFGPCGGFTATCDSSGTQSRTCTMYTCQAGTCSGTDYMDAQACSRVTNGVTCQGTGVSNCGPCSGSSQMGCAADGQQSCICTAHTCLNDSCGSTSSSCVQQTNCKELPSGDVCGITTAGCQINFIRDKCCSATGACTVLCGVCMQ